MTAEEARQLFAYGTWATGMMFRAVEALPPHQREAPAPSSFPSVIGTLAHIVSAEWIWLRRWLGESPAAIPSWAATPGLSQLRTQLAAVEAERGSFLGALTEADFERPVSYRTLAGQAFTDPLGHLMRHVVNHSTYHRGQVATQLRQLGHTPPNTDLIRYLREAK